MRLALIIWCLLTAVCPQLAGAQESIDWVEQIPDGYINWTQGTLVVKGVSDSRSSGRGSKGEGADALQQARAEAAGKIVRSLDHIRMDAHTSVFHHIAENATIRSKIEEMAAQAPVCRQSELQGGGVEVNVRIALRGGFSQLILPADIKQVDNIMAVNGETAQSYKEKPTGAGASPAADPDVYTGLVVDARGIDAKPALVPVLMDEDGKEVYGPAFVSREYAVQQGVCVYAGAVGDLAERRVGARPLLAKGLRTAQGRCCDIVVSNADASKIRGASAHLDLLKQCRVIILLD